MNDITDWDLIERSRTGGASAFEALVRRHEGPSLGYAMALLGDRDDAADALQDAFVRAYRALPRLRPDSAFGPWFRSIVRNICLDRLRSPRRRRHAALQPNEIDRVVWTEPTAGARLEAEQLAERIRDALGALSADHRTVLLLREVDGLSYAEIAAALQLAPGTVASRLNHARAALRTVLIARGVAEEDVS